MTGPLNWILILIDRVTDALYAIAMAALAAITFLFLMEIIGRYAFNAPTTWSSEAIGYLLAALIFFALPSVTREKIHVTIDIVPTMLRPELRKWLLLATGLVAVAVICITAWITTVEALKQFDRGVMTNGAHPIPRWLVTGGIALGLSVTALQSVRTLFQGTE